MVVLSLLAAGGDASAQTCSTSIARTRADSRYELVTGSTPAGSEVRDKITGLIWQRCVQGMSWNGTTCTGVATAHTWVAAMDLARTAATTTASPATPWRLPNQTELFSLPERACSAPAINTTWFPAEPGGWAWSSSPVSGFASMGWATYFDFGNGKDMAKASAGEVRLVRSSQ